MVWGTIDNQTLPCPLKRNNNNSSDNNNITIIIIIITIIFRQVST